MLLNLTENDFFSFYEKRSVAENMQKMRLRPGLSHPIEGTHEVLPNRLVGWERTPLLTPQPTKEKDGIYRFCVRIWPRLEYAENVFVAGPCVFVAGVLSRTPLE